MNLLMFGLSDHPGGLESVIYPMLPYFKKAGIHIDFVNAFPGHLFREDWLTSNGIKVYRLNLLRRGRIEAYKKEINSFFASIKNGYDGIWMNVNEPDNGDLLFYAKKHRLPIRIVVGHSSSTAHKPDFWRKCSVFLSKRLFSHYATSRIGVSIPAAQFAFGKAKSIVIHSGIDIEKFRFSSKRRASVRDRLGIAPETKVFACVSRLVESKNLFFLLQTFAEILKEDPSAVLLLIGRGSLEAALKEKANELNIVAHVNFITNSDDVSGYLDASDYFVFPSLWEGLPISLIEAQCSGLPCFVSDSGITAEVQVSTLFSWLSLKDGSAKWAQEILSYPVSQKREEAYKTIQSHMFDIPSTANQYIDVICGKK